MPEPRENRPYLPEADPPSDVLIGEQVIWCSRPGHPGPYAHTHPYISALCSSGEDHAGCTIVGRLSHAPDFCDCECHPAVPETQANGEQGDGQ